MPIPFNKKVQRTFVYRQDHLAVIQSIAYYMRETQQDVLELALDDYFTRNTDMVEKAKQLWKEKGKGK